MLRARVGYIGIVVFFMFGTTGCASLSDVYLHDVQLNETATAASSAFDNAQSTELWQTMLDNVTASAEIEQRILAKSAQQRFEGKLTNLENLKWIDLRRCARGACWSDYQAQGGLGLDLGTLETTQDKLQYLHDQIEQLAKEVSRLEDAIRNPVNVESTSPLEISSTLTDAIERAEQGIQTKDEELEALKNDGLANLQAHLDELGTPLIDLFPRDQRAQIKEKIDRAFESVLETLSDSDGILDVQATLEDEIVGEIDELLLDAGIEVGSESGPTEEFYDEMIARFKARAVDLLKLDQLLAPLNSIAVQVNGEIKSAESTIGELQALLDEALGSSATPSQTARAVTDLFNKTEHPALLKLASIEELLQGGLTNVIRQRADNVNIGAAFEDIKNADVSAEFVSALESDVNKSICDPKPCQVKHVVDFLKNDESRIEVIRRSMLAEFRTSELAIYNEQLRSIKDELIITKDLAAIQQEQLNKQGILADKVERQMAAQNIDENLTVFHGLDCLARSAGRTEGERCAADTKVARDHLSESLTILAAYFALNGHLKEQEQQQWIALIRQRHRASIVVSKLAARSREQLIEHGLQGLVAFTDGGITADQIAGVLRLVNSSLLAVIAEGQ